MSWSFARTPKWIVRHVAVVLLCAVMVFAMFWQIGRLQDKREHARVVEARQEVPVADVREVVPADAEIGSEAIDDVLYRSVRATGRYADRSVVVENRTYNGAPGAWVLTPLVVEEGLSVLVNRGFIGFTRDGEIVAPEPPEGEVRVEGLVHPSQERGSFGAQDPDAGVLDVLARVDLARVDQQVPGRLLPAYVQLVESDPPERGAPAGVPQLVALGAPDLDEGPHLGYAVQWGIFTTIAAGGYVLLLRKVAKDQAGDERRRAGAGAGGGGSGGG